MLVCDFCFRLIVSVECVRHGNPLSMYQINRTGNSLCEISPNVQHFNIQDRMLSTPENLTSYNSQKLTTTLCWIFPTGTNKNYVIDIPIYMFEQLNKKQSIQNNTQGSPKCTDAQKQRDSIRQFAPFHIRMEGTLPGWPSGAKEPRVLGQCSRGPKAIWLSKDSKFGFIGDFNDETLPSDGSHCAPRLPKKNVLAYAAA